MELIIIYLVGVLLAWFVSAVANDSSLKTGRNKIYPIAPAWVCLLSWYTLLIYIMLYNMLYNKIRFTIPPPSLRWVRDRLNKLK